jgi:RNA polymerase sigma factor (sigma-70 family)
MCSLHLSTPEELFNNYKRLVAPIVSHYYKKLGASASYDELYQWGLIGLWDASKRWVGEIGGFSSYAKGRISGQIIDEYRVSTSYIRRLGNSKQPKYVNLDDDNDEERPNLQLVACTQPLEQVIHTHRNLRRLSAAFYELTGKEICILLLFYFDGIKLQEIAEQLELSEARICQIKTAAIKKLKQATCLEIDF